MTRCTRCCLHSSMKMVNIVVNLCGIGMIVYSLWLLKKWYEGVAELGSSVPLPRPWFIVTCLSVGMVVCLSTLCGHMVYNCMTNHSLAIYILSICSLLSLQVAVIVTIYFKMDWASEIDKYIDDNHKYFERFVIFHLTMCRCITVIVVVAQANVVLLAAILWFVGIEPRIHCHTSDPPSFRFSFLIGPDSPLLESDPPGNKFRFSWRRFSRSQC
ncbi:Tetraspanin/Peripherin [Dillenia turbinata]|uniref:Tetraspanin/Peripherin n=1 Tax=Dillenia turbinata TaxID=194707 RepID=A0AAN8V623_9MAGN